MLRLTEKSEYLHEDLRMLAADFCVAVDGFRRDMAPSSLESIQLQLQVELARTELELGRGRRRKKKRSSMIQRRCLRNRELLSFRHSHETAIKLYEELLKHRRSLLHQIGDACAWLVLRADPHLIMPHCLPAANPRLPQGIGLYAPTQIRREAHKSVRFLVMQCDLTRCLGIGDLLVVRADGRWVRPIAFEVKASEDQTSDVEIDAYLTAYCSTHPLDREMLSEFCQILEFTEGDKRLSVRAERQIQRLQERGNLLWELSRFQTETLPNTGHWERLREVLDSAARDGSAIVEAEPGIVFVAIRNRVEDDPQIEIQHTLSFLKRSNLTDTTFGLTSLDALYESGYLTALIAPIPLWNLPVEHRISLLTREIFFGCLTSPTVWQEAFANHGIEMLDTDDIWTLSRGERSLRWDRIETRKLAAGAAFGAFSPKQIAEVVSSSYFEKD